MELKFRGLFCALGLVESSESRLTPLEADGEAAAPFCRL